jgi:hypothetical protein
MKLVTFSTGTTNQVDVANAGVVRDVSELLPSGAGMLEVIEAWDELWPTLRGRTTALPILPLDSVELRAPIPTPRRNISASGRTTATTSRNSAAAATTLRARNCQASRSCSARPRLR